MDYYTRRRILDAVKAAIKEMEKETDLVCVACGSERDAIPEEISLKAIAKGLSFEATIESSIKTDLSGEGDEWVELMTDGLEQVFALCPPCAIRKGIREPKPSPVDEGPATAPLDALKALPPLAPPAPAGPLLSAELDKKEEEIPF